MILKNMTKFYPSEKKIEFPNTFVVKTATIYFLCNFIKIFVSHFFGIPLAKMVQINLVCMNTLSKIVDVQFFIFPFYQFYDCAIEKKAKDRKNVQF